LEDLGLDFELDFNFDLEDKMFLGALEKYFSLSVV
jgi:hypothetical protein